jgi:hypothetical protein
LDLLEMAIAFIFLLIKLAIRIVVDNYSCNKRRVNSLRNTLLKRLELVPVIYLELLGKLVFEGYLEVQKTKNIL